MTADCALCDHPPHTGYCTAIVDMVPTPTGPAEVGCECPSYEPAPCPVACSGGDCPECENT